ncbi:MAG: type IV pilus biogenesis/stability protein PilW [Lautropia sp.]
MMRRSPSADSANPVPRAARAALAAAALALASLAGCVTTESTRGAGAGAPPGGSAGTSETRTPDRLGSDRGSSPVSSVTSPGDETRRRARIRLELSANHYQQRNFALALQEAEQSVGIDPKFAAGYGMLGLVYMAINDRNRADDSFRRALQLEPRDAELNNNYGWYLCQTGRQREAIPYFDNALEDRLYPTPSKPLHNAGICLLQIGDDASGENYLLRSFQADPSNPVANFNLGELYLKRRNLERAKFYSDRLMSGFQPTSETLWLALRVARLGRDQDYANRLASQLRSRFPQSRETALLLRGAFGD